MLCITQPQRLAVYGVYQIILPPYPSQKQEGRASFVYTDFIESRGI